MRRASFENLNCSIAQTLEVVGDWWSPMIIRDAFFGVSRFDEFQRRLGIARNILTDRLEWLCRHGVLDRVPYQDNPTRYDYVLTDKGRDLLPVMVALREWGDRWGHTSDNPPVLATDTDGDPVELRIVNTRTGRRIPADRVRVKVGPGADDPNMIPPHLTLPDRAPPRATSS